MYVLLSVHDMIGIHGTTTYTYVCALSLEIFEARRGRNHEEEKSLPFERFIKK